MITGAHSIPYSKDAEADRAFLRDVLKAMGPIRTAHYSMLGARCMEPPCMAAAAQVALLALVAALYSRSRMLALRP
jgi:hypothetical protein